MAERPLLLFPQPAKASRSKLGGGGSKVHKPSPQQQWERLSPAFDRLRAAFEAERIQVQQNLDGAEPEKVLVIEIAGRVADFARAVKRIEGFEWMGEIEIDEISPDKVFLDEGESGKPIGGRLYVVMSNQQALNGMLSLWERYQKNPDMKFERGLTRFRDVFTYLNDIRFWDVQDRLDETGVKDYWRQELELDDGQPIPFELELWFRGGDRVRYAESERVAELVRQAGGSILGQSVIKEIAYHGILAELPANEIRAILDDPSVELAVCDDIMFFRPSGQMMVGDGESEGETEISTVEAGPVPTGEPVVAVLDGAPLANHRLLADRIIVDDPDDWEAQYPAVDRVHGTSMASLVVHGDLNQPEPPLSRRVYVRPIMKPMDWPTTPRPERVPKNGLAVDLIHRAVKRIFEGEHGEGPVAPQIRVINLAIGDRSRQFMQSMPAMSPMAKLLDWLSVEYRALFIVSAGNQRAPIELSVSEAEFKAFRPDELETATVTALYRDVRNRGILSPAETINGITVGAAHYDASQIVIMGRRTDPFQQVLPSPISAFGGGYRHSIKPDLIFYGGKQLYRLPPYIPSAELVSMEPDESLSPPGNKTASPGNTPAQLNAASHYRGTSNATALISRAANICYDSLLEIFAAQAPDVEARTYDVPLLKAMLVHGCSWNDVGGNLKSAIENSGFGEESRARIESMYSKQSAISNAMGKSRKSLLSRWMGYGIPRLDRALDCTAHRATLLGYGELSDGEAHKFTLPLPPSLSAKAVKRHLTVTLAWLSPISPRTQKYRTASLWFETEGNDGIADSRQDADWQAARRGTVQHEVFVGDRAMPFVDGDAMKIKVNCRKDAGDIESPVAYGLAVSLEIAEGIDIAVYDEIRTRLKPPVPVGQATV